MSQVWPILLWTLLLSLPGCQKASPALPEERTDPPIAELTEALQEGNIRTIQVAPAGRIEESIPFRLEGTFGVSVATIKEVTVSTADHTLTLKVVGHWFYDPNTTGGFPCVCTPFEASSSFTPHSTGSYSLVGGMASATIQVE